MMRIRGRFVCSILCASCVVRSVFHARACVQACVCVYLCVSVCFHLRASFCALVFVCTTLRSDSIETLRISFCSRGSGNTKFTHARSSSRAIKYMHASTHKHTLAQTSTVNTTDPQSGDETVEDACTSDAAVLQVSMVGLIRKLLCHQA